MTDHYESPVDRRRGTRAPAWRFPAIVFGIAFLAAFAVAYGIRASSNDSASDDRGESPATVAVDTTPVTDSTPLALPSTTEPPTTEAPPESTEAPPQTDAPPATDATAPRPSLGAGGAFLRPLAVGAADGRLLDQAVGCASLAAAGVSSDGCDLFQAGGVSLGWVSGGGRLEVLQQGGTPGEETWGVKLRADGAGFTVRTGDGVAALVAARRRGDGDDTLSVDVVDVLGGGPEVSLHLDLIAGRAIVSENQIDAWNGDYADGDQPGAPSRFSHWVIQRRDGVWQVVESSTESPESVPASQL